eukprot:4850506-Pleurochrysis_carterae.AAC.1
MAKVRRPPLKGSPFHRMHADQPLVRASLGISKAGSNLSSVIRTAGKPTFCKWEMFPRPVQHDATPSNISEQQMQQQCAPMAAPSTQLLHSANFMPKGLELNPEVSLPSPTSPSAMLPWQTEFVALLPHGSTKRRL